MSAGNYGVVCQMCVAIDRAGSDCNTCKHHISRLREQAAIAAMQRLLEKYDSRISTPQEMAKYAIGYADALIDALKERS